MWRLGARKVLLAWVLVPWLLGCMMGMRFGEVLQQSQLELN